MEIRAYGWKVEASDNGLYRWTIHVETAAGETQRQSTVSKPHRQAKRNAQHALMRLRHKIGGTKPRRRLSFEGQVWARELGIPH